MASFPVFIPAESFPSILSHETLSNHFQTNLPAHSSTITSPVRQKYTVSPPSSSSSCTTPTKSHLAAKPSLRRVIIWSRTPQKDENLAETLSEGSQYSEISFESHDSLDEIIPLGDIISCATNSTVPLVKGEFLKSGTHLDLVGSFSHEMKECDHDAIKSGSVFVDNDTALEDAGVLVGAFERGVIKREEICGNLVDLIYIDREGRKNSSEITVFKSVGSKCTVDLSTAQLVHETHLSRS